MTDPAIQIIAKAIEPQIDTVELVLTDPLTLRKLRSERLARAALKALRAAGYWVARWEPIEGAQPFDTVLIAEWRKPYRRAPGYWRRTDDDIASDGVPLNYRDATHFMPLPPPPDAGSEKGGGG